MKVHFDNIYRDSGDSQRQLMRWYFQDWSCYCPVISSSKDDFEMIALLIQIKGDKNLDINPETEYVHLNIHTPAVASQFCLDIF